MSDRIRVIQYGLGPIGSAVARHVIERAASSWWAAWTSIRPSPAATWATSSASAGRWAFRWRPDCPICWPAPRATRCCTPPVPTLTCSKVQIVEILAAGLDVVSTAEELSFPWLAHPAEAAEIDAAARRAGKTVLGTGVNPGFVMDALPLFLTGICQRVNRVA